jgi:hypothetical protein
MVIPTYLGRHYHQLWDEKEKSWMGVDLISSLCYTMRMDPDSFIYRLQHTIALLEVETQQGVEDWTPTIARLKEVLAEEMALAGA